MNAPMAAVAAKVGAFEEMHPKLFALVMIGSALLLLASAFAPRLVLTRSANG